MNTQPSDPPADPSRYRIRVAGRLAPRWATRFDGMELIPQDDGTTLIQGPVVDQAALHGLLHQIRDAGLPLVSVRQVGPVQHQSPTTEPR